MRVFTVSHYVCKAKSRKVSGTFEIGRATAARPASLSVKDFEAPEYNLLFAVFRLMPSKEASANGTGASGKDNVLSILISYCYDFAARRLKMSH